MGPHQVLKLKFSSISETIVSLVLSTSDIIWGPPVQELAVVAVKRGDGIAEFWELESLVLIFIVPLIEEFNLIIRTENANFLETLL